MHRKIELTTDADVARAVRYIKLLLGARVFGVLAAIAVGVFVYAYRAYEVWDDYSIDHVDLLKVPALWICLVVFASYVVQAGVLHRLRLGASSARPLLGSVGVAIGFAFVGPACIFPLVFALPGAFVFFVMLLLCVEHGTGSIVRDVAAKTGSAHIEKEAIFW